MKSVLSIRIKLLLALTIALFAVADAAAQATLKKLELTGSKPPARSGHALVNVNGKVFLLGGDDGKFAASDFRAAGDFFAQGLFDDLWQFEEGGVQFEEITPVINDLPEGFHQKRKQVKFPDRVGHDGKIYSLFGVVEGVGLNSDAFFYDPVLNRWGGNSTSGDPSCNKTRSNVNLASNNNDIFAMGGFGQVINNLANFVKNNCKYDPITGVFTEHAPMPEGCVGAAIASVGDNIFVVAGAKGLANGWVLGGEVLNYNKPKDTWEFVFGPESKPGELVSQASETSRELLSRAFMAYAQVGNTLYLSAARGRIFRGWMT